MACTVLDLGGGARAIVCGPRRRSKPCVECGRPSSRLCDWKLQGAKAGQTCSRALCERCTTSPAPDKDLCRAHARAWERHPKNPNRKDPTT